MNSEKKRILGLDISTSVLGLTIVEGNKETCDIVYMNHIEFKDCSDMWEKVEKFARFLESMTNDNPPCLNAVYVEDALMRFRPGFSSANTIMVLVKFNALCSFQARNHFSMNPKFVASQSARKLCGIKTKSKKICGKVVKEQVFDWAVAGPLKDKKFEMTRTGKYKSWNYDEVDSYVVARAGLVAESSNIKVEK